MTLERLAWSAACLGLALLAEITMRPGWVTLTVVATAVAFAALRLVLAAHGRQVPAVVRFPLAALALLVFFGWFKTFLGLTAGIALLSLIGGLKLLEVQSRRDIQVVALIIYFLCLALLLESDSFWMFGYLVAVCWVTTAGLLGLTAAPNLVGRRTNLRVAGRLLAQAAPVALIFWLLFPRFDGPLWQLPDDGARATSGLGDQMSPGDLTDLVLSDEVAFRVRFAAGSRTPPPEGRYWRGPVLHDFDGRTWGRKDEANGHRPAVEFNKSTTYRYTISLEPSHQPWVFALDWPAQWDGPGIVQDSDFMLREPEPVSEPIDVALKSYADVRAAEPLSADMRRRDLKLPAVDNPRTAALAAELRGANPGDRQYIAAVLAMFHDQDFYYTLHPPLLGHDSVDEFLFDTRRGFCGHYASAFAALMRAGGIPARVVTGYQGGTYNHFADYWILRQSDAHAWDEIWQEDRGWVRVDPTAVIPRERVEHGLNDAIGADAASTSRWQQRSPWLADVRLRLDALRLLWRERILQFDQGSQERLLEWLHIPTPDALKLATLLAACLLAGMAWLTWQVRRDLKPRPRDPVVRAYALLCRRLAAAGLRRLPHEGAEDFAERVAARRPDLGVRVRDLCARYGRLRYGGETADSSTQFAAAVRAFRPRDSRGSS